MLSSVFLLTIWNAVVVIVFQAVLFIREDFTLNIILKVLHPLDGFIYILKQVIIPGKNGAKLNLENCKLAKFVN